MNIQSPTQNDLLIQEYAARMPKEEASVPLSKIPAKPKGFSDLSPAEQVAFARMKQIIQDSYLRCGFNPLDVPPFVHRKFLLAEAGMQSQIFSVNHLSDNSMTKYGLAFDRTVPFALWVRDHQREIPLPYKRYDISLSYRAESTESTRFNGFYQADVDIVGKDLSLSCDAECITTLVSTLEKLNIPPFVVYINHIEIPKELVKKLGFKDEGQALRALDDLDKKSEEQICEELQAQEPNFQKEEIQKLVKICKYRGSISEFPYLDLLGEQGKEFVRQVQEVLRFIQIGGVDTGVFQFAPGIVRGLNYYTGIVFETFLKDHPKFGSITSGGRYDKLVDTFTEKPTGIKGIGGSIGLSRLFQILLETKNLIKRAKTASKIIVLTRESSLFEYSAAIARKLRENQIETDVYVGSAKNIKKQLQYANEVGFPFAVMVMGGKNFVIRDLTSSQQTDDIDNVNELTQKALKIISSREKNLTIYTFPKRDEIDLGYDREFSIEDFYAAVYGPKKITLSLASAKRLDETREFINYLLENNIKVYGLTTGFADLRNKSVSPDQASLLSHNILISHDAGIGNPLPMDIVRGAMVIRANALSKGYSGFQKASLETLISMINANIIPEVPSTGSLGASGDLALLARLGRAMEGDAKVFVHYNGERISAKEALEKAQIKPMKITAKEGLALTNGTSFMASALAITYLKQMHIYENIFALMNLYLSATKSVDAAFNENMQTVRKQEGQSFVAEILRNSLNGSPLVDSVGIQNDYSQRCLPQILGPKIEDFLYLHKQIFNELDAVTDNPLIFRNEEISKDVAEKRILTYDNQKWAVLSGGNFHGELIAKIADELVQFSAKIALTMERNLTFLNNPSRNKMFPTYLIVDESQAGLQSGFMIPQYVANGLTQKICALANPVTNFNLTSANESEDIVSYGNAAVEKLLKQLHYLEELTAVYLTVVSQSYAITKQNYEKENGSLDPNLISEKIFAEVQKKENFPFVEDQPFNEVYNKMNEIISSGRLRKIIGNPLANKLGLKSMKV